MNSGRWVATNIAGWENWELMAEIAYLVSPLMAQIMDEFRGLYLAYPSWLVTACLVVVGLGIGWFVWKLVRFGMVVLVTAALLAIVAFAGWMILIP